MVSLGARGPIFSRIGKQYSVTVVLTCRSMLIKRVACVMTPLPSFSPWCIHGSFLDIELAGGIKVKIKMRTGHVEAPVSTQ